METVVKKDLTQERTTMEKDDIYYVYAHLDNTGKTVYIGKGQGGRAFSTNNRKGGHGAFMMGKLTNGDVSFVFFLHKNLSSNKALEIEEQLIKEMQPEFNRFFTNAWKDDNKNRGLKGANATKKKCITPLGTFNSISEAARQHGFKDAGSILYRIKKGFKNYEYV